MPGIKSEKRPEKIALVSQFKIKKTGNSYILYDAGIIAEPALQLFEPDYHTNQHTRQKNSNLNTESGIGRARVVYFSYQEKPLVLKHYYRGGAVAAILKDRYLGFKVENSRAFREWRLLKKMRNLGLPVPDAVAAQVKKGLLFYRADLITEEIKNVQTLAEVLQEKVLPAEQWQQVGACIKLFHKENIYHADLNARNILLSEAGDVYLIDFDNSSIRTGSETWKMANLARLQRSLLKFKRNRDGFHFVEDNWRALLQGYKQ